MPQQTNPHRPGTKAASAVLRQTLSSKRLEPGGGGPTPGLTRKLEVQTALVRSVSTMPLSSLGNLIQSKGKPIKQ